MKIRRAAADDSMPIARAEKEIFSDAWSHSDILRAITSAGAMCYVATSDSGELYAYIIGRTIMPEGEIYRIATKEPCRCRGIAYRLLDYALKSERKGGLESIFLEVREKNIPARKLYAAYGFQEIGLRKKYYRDPEDNAVLMMKTDSLTL